MKMILRAPGRRINRERDGAVRHFRTALHAHKVARLPRQPEEIGRLRLGQQRAFGTVDTVRRHQQILQRPVAIFKHHVTGIRFHLRARRGIAVLLLIWNTLFENDMTQCVRITGLHPEPAARYSHTDDQRQHDKFFITRSRYPVEAKE